MKLLNNELINQLCFNTKQDKLWVNIFHWINLETNLLKSFKKHKKSNFLMIKINLIQLKMFHIQILKFLKVILLSPEKIQFNNSENLYQLF
jgi:hypothetical protein